MIENDGTDVAAQASRGVRRVARPQAPLIEAVLLADVSISMEMRDGPGPKLRDTVLCPVGGGIEAPRRIDRLASVLDYLLRRVRVRSLVCFSDLPVEMKLTGKVVLPEPGGSTALHVALEHVAGMASERGQAFQKVFVLSDGEPNDMVEALMWARRLRPAVIDAYYVGPESGHGLRFMRELALAGGPGGRSGHFDMVDPVLLGSELHKRLLAGPDA